MAERETFDLVLFGYRNDLARARVLEYLDTLPPDAAGMPVLDHTSPVPVRLLSRIGEDLARELQRELERRGAHVRLSAVSPKPVLHARVPRVNTRRSWVRGGLLATGLMLAVMWWLTRSGGSPIAPGATGHAVPSIDKLDLRPLPVAAAEEPAEASQLNTEAVELAQAGQYDAAVDRLQRALRLVADQPVIKGNLQRVLLSWGLHELEAHRPPVALSHLYDALAIGERADIRQAMGLAHRDAGDFQEARADLERAVDAGSTDAATWLALADVYLKLNDRPRALDRLQRAREAGASGHELDVMVERLSREVDAEWDYSSSKSAHFRATFPEGHGRRVAPVVLAELERARLAVGGKFGYLPPEVTEVVLYPAQDFHAVTQTPDWAGGAFDGRIKVPVGGLAENDPNLPRVLRHEYMHSVVATLTGSRCPVWVTEGLAVWAEEDYDGERGAWAEERLRGTVRFVLADLGGPFTRFGPEGAEVAYAQSYLTIREMIDRYGVRKLQPFLTELSQRELPEAFATVYPGTLSDFEAQLRRPVS